MVTLTNTWHPSKGLRQLWNQINNAANYTIFAGAPIPESILVDSALICIAKTQAYKQAYLDFKRETDQTLVHLKRFFDERDNDRREVEEEAGAFGYGMNAMENASADDDEATQHFRRTLTDFAANMAESETVYSKISEETNQHTAQMAASLQNMQQGLAQLTQQMAMMTATNRNQPASQRPVQPPTPYNPPPPQYASPTQQFNPLQAMPGYCMPAMPTPQGQPFYQGVPMHNQRPPSNVKYFEGWDYCWSHGCDVSHNSAQCAHPKAGHMWNGTRKNMMGGSMKNINRTIMPSAVGRTAARKVTTAAATQAEDTAAEGHTATTTPTADGAAAETTATTATTIAIAAGDISSNNKIITSSSSMATSNSSGAT